MKRLLIGLLAVASLTGCTTIMVKPGASTYEFEQDKRACEYEALKYGHVEMWGSGVGAGIEEGMRKNEITRSCLEQKGWTAKRQ